METKIKKSIGFSISHTANLLNSSINKKIKPFGIAIEQRAILELINSNKTIKQTELVNILSKDKTTISRTLKALEDKNYIIKEKSDNRIYIIKLSKLGQSVLEKSEKVVSKFREKIDLELSSEEIDNLYKILNKLEKVARQSID
ncbi:MAG: hypothetical protein C0625_12605 [Arcobacter sp.]|nr:MAG: hypothetical protein C0625_12605 [Arcobacter sp.]